MALYDGLPLNTPTKIGGDGVTLEVWATRTANGGTVEERLIGAAAQQQANADAIEANLTALITSLQADVTQDNSIITGANPIIASTGQLSTLALSNDVRQLAQAVKTLASNDINNKRALSNLLHKIQASYTDITGT